MTHSAGRGFSLVEILVALVVMSIALIVLVTCFAGAVGTQRKVRDHAIAQNVAQSKIETLRNAGWDNLPWGTTAGSVSDLDDAGMITTVTLELPSLARIEVDVWWGLPVFVNGEARYRKGHVEYVTYMAQPVVE